MKRVFLFLIAIVIVFVPAFADDDVVLSEQNELQVQMDSLKSQIDKLQETVDSMTREIAYQRLNFWVKSIINESNILCNQIDIFNNTLLVFGVHEYLNRKTKKVFLESIKNYEDSAKTIENDLESWKLMYDFYNLVDFFNKDESELLKNRYLVALVAASSVENSIEKAKSKLD